MLIRLGISDGGHDVMLIMNIIVLSLVLAIIFYRTLVRLYQENYKGTRGRTFKKCNRVR